MQTFRTIIAWFCTLLGLCISGGCGYFIYYVIRYGERDFGTDLIALPIMFLTVGAVFGVAGGLSISMGIWEWRDKYRPKKTKIWRIGRYSGTGRIED